MVQEGEKMYNILICDDERDIVSALKIYLTAEGYTTLEAYNGKEAMEALSKTEVHLILMDIMMPELDGITATVRLRETYNIPVILLTAKSEDTDKVLGLNIGADDYITKPFNPVDMLARVRAQLRRYTNLGGMKKSENVIRIGGIELDDREKKVTLDDEPVPLTPKEYEILKLLMNHPGKVFSSTELYQAVWNDNAFRAEGTVAVHIRHLREKLEINPAEPRYLKVVWGQGYKIERSELR
jgi:DNA-binding response OmpR family regulator